MTSTSTGTSEAAELVRRGRDVYARDPAEGERLGAEAVALAERTRDAKGAADALAVIGMARFSRGDLFGAQEAAEEALARYRTLAPSRGQADALLLVGAIRRRRGETREAVIAAGRALEVADAIGDVDLQAVAHNNIGLAYGDLGALDEALSHYLEALARIDGPARAADGPLRASLYNNVALVHGDRGEHAEAARRLEQALDIVRAAGDLRQEARIGRNLASSLGRLDRWDEATVVLERVAALYEQLGEGPIGLALRARSMGEIALARGDLVAAEAELRSAAEHARGSGEVREAVAAALRLGRVLFRLDRFGEAEALARETAREAERLGNARNRIEAMDLLTDALEAGGKAAEALATSRAARSLQEALHEEARGRAVAELQTRFEVAQRRREAELLRERSVELERLVGARTAELRAALAAAEAANKAKTTFLAIASHELRTPLNAIIGYGEMVREELEDLGQGPVGDVDNVLASAQRLLALIDRILQMSNLEAGASAVDRAPFDVAEVIRALAAAHESAAAENGNRLVVEVGPLPGPMTSDREKVRLTLEFLLENAAKFTRDGEIGLAAEHDGAALICRVRDTGIGMDEATIAELFQPFTQRDAGYTRRFGGLGLGLALCRRYCQLLGGELSVTSAPDRGSVFEIRLPWA
jgi:signal transduction histidine kinase